jgi:dienelactone hydrolase
MPTRYILTILSILAATNIAFAGGHSSKVSYQVGSLNFEAVVVEPSNEPLATVYIIHDWNGLDEYEKSRAAMLAEAGYRAVALDLFGVDAKLEGFDDYRRETGALYGNREEFRARIAAGVSAGGGQTEHNFLAGYCFGGAAVLESARAGMDLDGFISFHGGLGTPEGQDYAQTSGALLILHGSADPVSGMGDLAGLIDQLTEAGVDHNVRVYGGARHSFTVPGSRDYLESADKKSWTAMMEFLEEELAKNG